MAQRSRPPPSPTSSLPRASWSVAGPPAPARSPPRATSSRASRTPGGPPYDGLAQLGIFGVARARGARRRRRHRRGPVRDGRRGGRRAGARPGRDHRAGHAGDRPDATLLEALIVRRAHRGRRARRPIVQSTAPGVRHRRVRARRRSGRRCAAAAAAGEAGLLVDAAADGVTVEPLKATDFSRPLARVVLDVRTRRGAVRVAAAGRRSGRDRAGRRGRRAGALDAADRDASTRRCASSSASRSAASRPSSTCAPRCCCAPSRSRWPRPTRPTRSATPTSAAVDRRGGRRGRRHRGREGQREGLHPGARRHRHHLGARRASVSAPRVRHRAVPRRPVALAAAHRGADPAGRAPRPARRSRVGASICGPKSPRRSPKSPRCPPRSGRSRWPRPGCWRRTGHARTAARPAPAEQLLIDQELAAAGVVRPDLVIGWWAAPTILEHGTPRADRAVRARHAERRTVSGASCSASPARAPTWRRCAPKPFAPTAVGSSPGRRCGRRRRTRRRLGRLPGAHRPRCAKAQGHHLLPGRHEVAGHRHPAAARDHRRQPVQRGVLRRRLRARRDGGRTGQRRLAAGPHDAGQRAGRDGSRHRAGQPDGGAAAHGRRPRSRFDRPGPARRADRGGSGRVAAGSADRAAGGGRPGSRPAGQRAQADRRAVPAGARRAPDGARPKARASSTTRRCSTSSTPAA